MMKFYKIEDGILQIGSGSVVPYGFMEYVEGKEPEELLLALKKEKQHADIYMQLAELDNATTSRTLREAALGNATAIEKIKSVEAKADELRKQLAELG